MGTQPATLFDPDIQAGLSLGNLDYGYRGHISYLRERKAQLFCEFGAEFQKAGKVGAKVACLRSSSA